MVNVYIASLWRGGHVVKTIQSLLKCPELTSITVVCNNYTQEQIDYVHKAIDYNLRVLLIKGNNEKGCSEKVRYLHQDSSKYIALCDDDLIYPPDYLTKLISAAEKYNCIVSVHGRILADGKATNYYRHKKKVYHCLHNVESDYEVDIIGSGACLFPRHLLDVAKLYDMIKFPNMTDIYLSWLFWSNGIKRMVVSHKKGWIKLKNPEKGDNYIYDNHANNCKPQTQFINLTWRKSRM